MPFRLCVRLHPGDPWLWVRQGTSGHVADYWTTDHPSQATVWQERFDVAAAVVAFGRAWECRYEEVAAEADVETRRKAVRR
jgi:hypothetical protein